jgi:hypothetical protein
MLEGVHARRGDIGIGGEVIGGIEAVDRPRRTGMAGKMMRFCSAPSPRYSTSGSAPEAATSGFVRI